MHVSLWRHKEHWDSGTSFPSVYAYALCLILQSVVLGVIVSMTEMKLGGAYHTHASRCLEDDPLPLAALASLCRHHPGTVAQVSPATTSSLHVAVLSSKLHTGSR
jgi:hypothetical protein